MQGQAYARALEEARKELKAGAPEMMAHLAGADYSEGEGFRVPFMDLLLGVTYPEGQVCYRGRETDVEVTVVVTHYLARSAGPLALRDPVRYQGLQGATAFAAAFRARVEQPLIERFGGDGPAFERAARRLGGCESGGVWQLPFLPHLPLGVRLGEADGMFPADCVVFFPRRAGFVYLVEDLAVCGQLLAGRLLNAAEEDRPGQAPLPRGAADAAAGDGEGADCRPSAGRAETERWPWDLPGLLAWAQTAEGKGSSAVR